MGGEGFIFSANASIKNNRRLMKEKNPFRKRARELHLDHIESRETKHFTDEEKRKLRIQLRRQASRDLRITILTFALIIIVLLVLILLIVRLDIL
ncbi:MAG: hypothetical protein JXR22_12625 [Prolixibacteraceae bacterium]|nr:hypothetical protein [Prolixibacteraceae bacterium]